MITKNYRKCQNLLKIVETRNVAENYRKLCNTLCLKNVEYLPAGCHGNLPVLNLLSASVAKNQHFRPCRKKSALDRKMIVTF